LKAASSSFIVLAEQGGVTTAAVVRLTTVRAFAGLSCRLTGFTALAAMTVAVELIVVRDAPASAFATDVKFASLCVVCCHLLKPAEEY
jgi:hypothetical protein